MVKIIHKLDTCTSMIVRVDVDGQHVDLSFASHDPKDDEIDALANRVAQNMVEEAKQRAMETGEIPSGILFETLLDIAEVACKRVADEWDTGGKGATAVTTERAARVAAVTGKVIPVDPKPKV